MNIAIIGYGNMGKIVERLAQAKGHEITSIIDPQAEGATHKEVNNDSLAGVDVAIEFSLPDVIINNIKAVANEGVNHVVATTGWNDQLKEVEKIIKKSNTGLIYASNFSIGVNAFFNIVEEAAKIINNIEDFDIFGYELHHNRKADSPSGTARSLGEILINNIKRKNKIVEEKLDRKVAKDEIQIASVRSGDIPGTHVIGFDSSADTIELKHTARNREGFALGSIMAADWIKNKKGIFSIDQMMKEVL